MNQSRMNNGQKLWTQNLFIIFSVTLMAIQGVAILTPAFPSIMQHYRIAPNEIGLLITLFTLPGVFLVIPMGILADRIGRKRILVPSLMLFGLGGILCSQAQSYHTLLIFRILQGLGAASLGVLNITLIGDLYHGKDRAAAMGYNASVLSIGTASYPLIGGGLSTVGWRFPFLLSALAIPVGFWVLFRMKNPEPKTEVHLKVYLKKTCQSIRNLRILIIFSIALLTFIILYGAYLTYFPVLLFDKFQASGLRIGLLLSSMSLMTALVSTRIGALVKRFRESRLIAAASVFYLLALVLIPLIPRYGLLFIPAVLYGLGHGLLIPTNMTLLAGAAPMGQRGVIMAVNGMVLRLGQTLGPVFAATLFGLGALPLVYFGSAVLAGLLFVLVWAFLD